MRHYAFPRRSTPGYYHSPPARQSRTNSQPQLPRPSGSSTAPPLSLLPPQPSGLHLASTLRPGPLHLAGRRIFNYAACFSLAPFFTISPTCPLTPRSLQASASHQHTPSSVSSPPRPTATTFCVSFETQPPHTRTVVFNTLRSIHAILRQGIARPAMVGLGFERKRVALKEKYEGLVSASSHDGQVRGGIGRCAVDGELQCNMGECHLRKCRN